MMSNNEELFFYFSVVSLAWTTFMTMGFVWLTDQNHKTRHSLEREHDRVTYLYDQLSRVETKADVKETLAELKETIEAFQEDNRDAGP